MRCLNHFRVVDSARTTQLLRDLAPRVVETFGASHHINASNLILSECLCHSHGCCVENMILAVTAIMDYPSGAGIVFQDENRSQPFYFYRLPPPKWGYWSVRDTPSGGEEDMDGTTIKISMFVS